MLISREMGKEWVTWMSDRTFAFSAHDFPFGVLVYSYCSAKFQVYTISVETMGLRNIGLPEI